MRPILLYSHADEPITKAILSSTLIQKSDLIKLPLKALLNEVSIIDEFDNEEVKIDWTFQSGLRITNSKDFYLINRVISVPEEIFCDFSEEDRQYSISEFRAYLAFAIEAFPNSFSKAGAFGLSGNRFSLPRQWETIKSTKYPIETPNYYLGNMEFCTLQGNLVYTNPFDFYYWKPNHDLVDIDKASFVFLKPPGKPIVGSVVGDHVKIFCCDSSDEISETMHLLLEKNSLLISRLFNHPIAEILFFVEEDNFIFGMISCIPYASNKKDWFPENVDRYFKDKLMEKNGKN